MTAPNPKGDSTISALPAAISLTGSESIPADQNQSGTLVTVRIPLNQIYTQIPPANFGVAMLAWFNQLPTSLPAQPGVLWNDGGTLSQS